MASVVHNPRCIERLSSLSSPSATPLTPTPPATTTAQPVASSVPHQEYPIGLAGENSASHSGTGFHRTSILPYVSLEDHVEQHTVTLLRDPFSHLATPLNLAGGDAILPTDSSSSSQVPPTDPALSQDMDCAPSPTQTASQCPADVFSSHFLQEDDGTLPDRVRNVVEGVLDSVTLELEEKMKHKVDKAVMERLNAQLVSKQDSSDSSSEAWKFPSSIFKPADSVSLLGKRSSSSLFDSSCAGISRETVSLSTPEPLREPLLFGTGASPSDGDIVDPLAPSVSRSVSETASAGKEEELGIVQFLFSNWPGIVTTVLGFNMTELRTPDRTPSFSSVHILDGFTTDLLLNCSDPVINCFVGTIVKKLNSALESTKGRSQELDASLFLQDIDYADPEVTARFAGVGEVGVAVLVGRRFLSSVVRVLALEHSRIKNRFLEMQQQQARQG